jgi:hypothetical protein
MGGVMRIYLIDWLVGLFSYDEFDDGGWLPYTLGLMMDDREGN